MTDAPYPTWVSGVKSRGACSLPVHRNDRLVFSLLRLIRRARDGIWGDIPTLLLFLLLLLVNVVVVVARLLGRNKPYKKEREKGKINSPPAYLSPLERESEGKKSTASCNVGISSLNTGPRTFK
ncbi:hypothetical protein CRENBAI_005773 [Crenichthys baileyi]|uniref:Uncharacterized protein n=1 Tax=Crenichthys baileyi TaxID=28760 RepID=A0AAV9S144_9TELE